VFAGPGLPDPEERLVKTDLISRIIAVIRAGCLNQANITRLFGRRSDQLPPWNWRDSHAEAAVVAWCP
jgi:hypothetical protein